MLNEFMSPYADAVIKRKKKEYRKLILTYPYLHSHLISKNEYYNENLRERSW